MSNGYFWIDQSWFVFYFDFIVIAIRLVRLAGFPAHASWSDLAISDSAEEHGSIHSRRETHHAAASTSEEESKDFDNVEKRFRNRARRLATVP